jgi:hypothetical protein
MHYFLQAFEVAVVHVCFHKIRAGSHIYISQSRRFELPVECGRKLAPLGVRV